jgi:predicted Zn-dependent peptidase
MMNVIKYFKTTVILVVLTIACLNSAPAQTVNFPQPREEKLLNGLRLLIWNEPKSEKVTVKLRIHSGAAFDPKDKMGVMALLADILFPNEQAKAYFTEDLEGSLDIASNYDYIQITATGKADEIQAILETLATTVTNPQITPENFAAVRNARLEKIKELEKNPAYVADRAIAKRLFGDFPYGRSAEGTLESLAKIDKTDLMLAGDRFFTADNATLAVIGNVKPDFVYRATRQLFGAWKKSESKIPATFRQPAVPDAKIQLVELPDATNAEIRIGSRGLARNDKDFFTSEILTRMLQEFSRQKSLPEKSQKYFVKQETHLLPGIFIMGASVPHNEVKNFIKFGVLNAKFRSDYLTQNQFDKTKSELLSEMRQMISNPQTLTDLWLDVHTFRLTPIAEQIRTAEASNLENLKQVFTRLLAYKNHSVNSGTAQSYNLNDARVVVGSGSLLKEEVEKYNVNAKDEMMVVGPKPVTATKP